MNKSIKIILLIIITFLSYELMDYILHRILHEVTPKIFKNATIIHYKHHMHKHPPEPETRLSVKVKYPNKDFIFRYIKTHIKEDIIVLLSYLLIFFIMHKLKIDHIYSKTVLITLLVTHLLARYFHYAFHVNGHYLNDFTYFKYVKGNHYYHHRDYCNYGVLTNIYDYIFKTYCNEKPKKVKNIFEKCDFCEESLK